MNDKENNSVEIFTDKNRTSTEKIDNNSKELAIFATKLNGYNFTKLNNFWGDNEVALTSLQNCSEIERSEIFNFVDTNLKNDPKFFIEAIKTESEAYIHDLCSMTSPDFFHVKLHGSIFNEDIPPSHLLCLEFQKAIESLDEEHKKYLTQKLKSTLSQKVYNFALNKIENTNYKQRLLEILSSHIKNKKIIAKLDGNSQHFYIAENQNPPK